MYAHFNPFAMLVYTKKLFLKPIPISSRSGFPGRNFPKKILNAKIDGA
jgi:hypothetical protein